MYAVLLYDCPAFRADGCSSCLDLNISSGFECGWCDRSSGMTDTCSFTGDCPSQNLATTGMQCPRPTIIDFNPKFGTPEGGTTITITGTDLGVSFSDFDENSIRVGDVNCMPTNPDDYLPGRRISCTTMNNGGSTGPNTILITLPNGAGASNTQFNIVSPEITGVFPSRGPQAGGTNLIVYGTNLDIGNTVNTRITLVGGTECTVE
jgi:plexin A